MTNTSKATVSSKVKNGLSVWWMLALVTIFVLGSYGTYMFAISPAPIRKPVMEHYHFRMQLIADGKPVNFGADKYQQGYSKDQCNVDLAEQPIHFHDNKDQFVHIHWDGMTGGTVLKYYGWNYIGGMNNALGYKLNDITDIQKVTIHGDVLPAQQKGDNMYVYVGDEHGYVAKTFDDFIHQDLETFFGKKSNFPGNTSAGLWDKLFPKASAHAGHDHEPMETGDKSLRQERLERINNLIGNVVIFAQKDEPTKAAVQDRFRHLEPLTESTCGG